MSAFIKQYYPNDIDLWTKRELFKRLNEGCDKFMDMLISPVMPGDSLEDFQKMIPSSYDVNISNIL